MNAGTLPSRYAQAIFDYATGCRAEDQVYDDLCRLADTLDRVEALRKLVANPLLPAADKASALLSACGKAVADDSPTARIVRMVTANKRADRMGVIAQAYIARYRHSKGIQPAHVTTPAPLADDTARKIEALVTRDTGCRSVMLQADTDPALIGGFVLRVGDRLLDASVGKQLARMRRDLTD